MSSQHPQQQQGQHHRPTYNNRNSYPNSSGVRSGGNNMGGMRQQQYIPMQSNQMPQSRMPQPQQGHQNFIHITQIPTNQPIFVPQPHGQIFKVQPNFQQFPQAYQPSHQFSAPQPAVYPFYPYPGAAVAGNAGGAQNYHQPPLSYYQNASQATGPPIVQRSSYVPHPAPIVQPQTLSHNVQAQQSSTPQQTPPTLPPQTEQTAPPPRKKKLLQIIDPNSGELVVTGPSPAPTAASTSPQPSAEAVSETEEVSVVSDEEEPTSHTPQPPPPPPPTEVETEISKRSKAKVDFYQKITAVADEKKDDKDKGGRSSTTPESQPVPELSSEEGGVSSSPPLTSPPSSSPPQTHSSVNEEAGGEVNEELDISLVSNTSLAAYIEDSPKQPTPVSTSPPSSSPSSSLPPPPKYTAEEEEEEEVGELSKALSKLDTNGDEGLGIKEAEDSPPQSTLGEGKGESELVNGGDFIEGRGHYALDEVEDMEVDEVDDEEGELEEGEIGENEEEVEEGGEEEVGKEKKRIIFTRDQLLQYKLSKTDTNLLSNLPGEILKSNSSGHGSGAPQRGGNNMQGGAYPHRMGHGGSPMHGGSKGRMDGRMGGGGDIRNTNMGMNRMGFMNIPPPPPSQRPPPKVFEFQKKEKVILHQAENAWKPSVAKKGGDDEEKDTEQKLMDDLCKKTRSILNKLTPENLSRLVKKFIELPLEEKDERIGAVISIVFEKAIAEPSFSTAYATMVSEVCKLSQNTSKIFRKKILDQCQKEFQDGSKGEEKLKALELKLSEAKPEDKDLIKLELEEEKLSVRRRSLGNVRFIGELYKLAMLTPKIMNECIYMLIDQRDEESLECLCKLLTTIGQKLDNQLRDIEFQMGELQRQGKPVQKWVPEPKFMDTRFERLKTMSNDKSFSSRIRFALLDVYELRLNGWKPRRDANAPKTIEEVRLAAQREEIEEKNKIMNLPPAQNRPNVPQQQQQQQQKKGDWNTVASNKSSRFQAGRPKAPQEQASPGDLPKFAPQSSWSFPRSGPQTPTTGYQNQSKLPPRFNKFNEFSGDGPTPPPSREDIVQALPPTNRSSSYSSRESSRPQTPTFVPPPTQLKSTEPPPPPPKQEFDIGDSVKNIFKEFESVRKLDYDWIRQRFPGDQIVEFVDELSRQVCDFSKEIQQKAAGAIIKLIIENKLITKAQVIKSFASGVLMELSDIEIDAPKAPSYFAMFLIEAFLEEEDLSWLLSLGESMSEEYPTTWASLVTHTLNTLKHRLSEEAVQVLYKKTNGGNKLPTQDIPWIVGETIESLSAKMFKVLQEQKDASSLSSMLSENSWDFREEVVLKSLIEAICQSCLNPDKRWDKERLENLLGQIKLPSSPKIYPTAWSQAKDFIERNKVDKDGDSLAWEVFKNKLTPQNGSEEEKLKP